MISLICCYNNQMCYDAMVKSLKLQNVPYELIGIDNRKNKYKSASSALNLGGHQSTGDILIFLHQDIIFEEKNSVKKFAESLPHDKKAIIGLYGASHKKPVKIENELLSAETLDECCIAMTKKTWENYQFDDKFCDGWHLYAAELCLRAGEDGVIIAFGNFPIIHQSLGHVDEKYMATFKQLLIKYKNHKWIATTCKKMPTNMGIYYLYYAIWKVKKLIFGDYPLMYHIKKNFLKK